MPCKSKKKYKKKKAKYYKLMIKEKGKWRTPRSISYWGKNIKNKFTKYSTAFKYQRNIINRQWTLCKIKKY